tara:strand:- start:2 stop:697 length:696 start_codon:yes stop_codon:yes gene_type:complete
MSDNQHNSASFEQNDPKSSSVPPFSRDNVRQQAGVGADAGQGPHADNSDTRSPRQTFLDYVWSDRMADWLLVYVKRNPKPYAKTYLRMVEKRKLSLLTWSFPAFFFSFAWFFYRRMWVIGIVILALPEILGQFSTEMATGALFAIPFVSGVMGEGLYLNRAFRRIYRIDQSAETDEEKHISVEDAGGVSYVGAMLGGIMLMTIYGVILMLAGGAQPEVIQGTLSQLPHFMR